MGLFWICGEHRVDNLDMFFVIAEQNSHRARVFSAFSYDHTGKEVGGAWKAGRRHNQDR